MTEHGIAPVYDELSEILILGSFPSVQSRARGFFYSNPNNRFWTVLTMLYQEEPLNSIEEKIAFLLRRRIAVYDTILRCDIKGSSDSSIKNVVPADLQEMIQNSRIRRVFTNGKLAHKLYRQYQLPLTGIEDVNLPSTSSANASYHLEQLLECWRILKAD